MILQTVFLFAQEPTKDSGDGGLDWNMILLVLTTALGGGGFFSAWITGRNNRELESAKLGVEENQNELDAQRVKLEGWDGLVTSLQTENARKDKRIEDLEAKIAKFAANNTVTTTVTTSPNEREPKITTTTDVKEQAPKKAPAKRVPSKKAAPRRTTARKDSK